MSSATRGRILDIRGVHVNFPFVPYDCQVKYMTKVIEALQSGEHALLESPTGTGKTLSLLCATLAWQRSQMALRELRSAMHAQGKGELAESARELYDRLSDSVGSYSKKEGIIQTPDSFKIAGNTYSYAADNSRGKSHAQESRSRTAPLERPQIIYASRTHSQLSQVIKELKATIYRPRVALLGSRQQLCVHPVVSRVSGSTAQKNMCRTHVQNRTCRFHVRTEKYSYHDMSHANGRIDAEPTVRDIEDLGQLGKSDGVCPYYLMRESTTQNGADVLVMPYNYLVMPSVRESLTINWEKAIVIFDEGHNLESTCQDAASFDLTSEDIASCVMECQLAHDVVTSGMLDGVSTPPTTDEALRMKMLVLEVEKSIDSIQMGSTHPGSYIYDVLEKKYITQTTVPILLEVLEKILDVVSGQSRFESREPRLMKFRDLLRLLFDQGSGMTRESAAMYYRIHVHDRAKSGSSNNNKKTSRNSGRFDDAPKSRVLSFWCFSPGIAFEQLLKLGVHSVILTSGTLSPLEAVAQEFRQQFPVRLENPHVVGDDQVWVGVLARGVTSKSLNGSYRNRSSPVYLTELGGTIVNIARIVPDGLLIFFASYTMLDSCVRFWKSHEGGRLWARINTHKHCVVEPRGGGASSFHATAKEYEALIGDTSRGSKKSGAIFFAVCRGRASEGIDFSDRKARAVVVVGIPYPPLKDPRVICKRKFLDTTRRRPGMTAMLTGEQWYAIQASQAVNQAIGRVIRHKDDYGAIILCDERFGSHAQKGRLSRWIQPQWKVCSRFGEVAGGLTKFFKNIRQRRRGNVRSSNSALNVPLASSNFGRVVSKATKQAQSHARSTAAATDDLAAYFDMTASSSSTRTKARDSLAGRVVDSTAKSTTRNALASLQNSRASSSTSGRSAGLSATLSLANVFSKRRKECDASSVVKRPKLLDETIGKPSKSSSLSLSHSWIGRLDHGKGKKHEHEYPASRMRPSHSSARAPASAPANEPESSQTCRRRDSGNGASNMTVKQFLAAAKSSLPKDAYNDFVSLLRRFKRSVTSNKTATSSKSDVHSKFQSLFDEAVGVFARASDSRQRQILAEGFACFVPKREKATWELRVRKERWEPHPNPGPLDEDRCTKGQQSASQYSEGSSSNKYFELYNPSNESVDLSNYHWAVVTNAPSTPGEHETYKDFESGAAINAGGTFVVCNPNADPFILSMCNMTSSSFSHNGDDALCLTFGPESSHETLDCVGDYMGDPGNGWDVCGVNDATKDHTLKRKCTVMEGNDGNWAMSAGTDASDCEWDVALLNDWSTIGIRDCSTTASTTLAPSSATTTTEASTPTSTSGSAPTTTTTLAPSSATTTTEASTPTSTSGSAQTTTTAAQSSSTTGAVPTTTMAPIVSARLFISEYSEGSSFNKYFEVFNPSNESVDLSNYHWAVVTNAPSTPGEHETYKDFESGAAIDAGGTFVVCNPNADPFILSMCNMTSSSFSHTGDDALCLTFGPETSHETLDCVGDYMGDPGNGWDVCGVNDATKDHTLKRKCSTLSGNHGNWTISAGTDTNDCEWLVSSLDDWGNMGSHGPCNLFISEYAEGSSGSDKFWTVYNAGNEIALLDAFAFAMVSNAPDTPGIHDQYFSFPTNISVLPSE
eukprot:g2617.t1